MDFDHDDTVLGQGGSSSSSAIAASSMPSPSSQRFISLRAMWESMEEDAVVRAVDQLLTNAANVDVDTTAQGQSALVSGSSETGTSIVLPIHQVTDVIPMQAEAVIASGPSIALPASPRNLPDDLQPFGDSEPFSPRLRSIIDSAGAKLSKFDSDKLCRLLARLDVVSVVHHNIYSSGEEIQAEAESYCNANGLRISNSLRSLLPVIWDACVQTTIRNVKAKVDQYIRVSKPPVLVASATQQELQSVAILNRPPLPKAPARTSLPVLQTVQRPEQMGNKLKELSEKWDASFQKALESLFELALAFGSAGRVAVE